MHNPDYPPRQDDARREDYPAPSGEQPQPPDYPPRIPPPPPPVYYPPVDTPAPYRRPAQPEYGSGDPNARGPYGPYRGFPGGYPPPPVPVEQLYTEQRPQRRWLRIPLDRPIFTMAILIVLVSLYVPMFFSEEIAEAFFTYGPKDNRLIVEGEWWRILTATLLHGYPFHLHILFNGYALYALGNDLEALGGRWRFLAIYWVSALGGSVASFAFSPAQSVGASGAIFGLIGAMAVYFGLHRNLFGRIGQAQFWNIIVVIILNVGIGLSRIFPIDNAAHIGGLVTGAAAGFVLCPRYALGNWRFPNVRDIRNTNQGRLTWLAFTLIALDVIAAFFVVLLLYQKGYWRL